MQFELKWWIDGNALSRVHILSHVKCAARDNNDTNQKNSNKILCLFNCSSAAASLSGRRSATESNIQNTIISLNGWFCDCRNFISFQFVRPKFQFVCVYSAHRRLQLHAFRSKIYVLNWFQLRYIYRPVRACVLELIVCVFAIDANEFYLRLYSREQRQRARVPEQNWPRNGVVDDGRWGERTHALTLFVHTASHIANTDIYL